MRDREPTLNEMTDFGRTMVCYGIPGAFYARYMKRWTLIGMRDGRRVILAQAYTSRPIKGEFKFFVTGHGIAARLCSADYTMPRSHLDE